MDKLEDAFLDVCRGKGPRRFERRVQRLPKAQRLSISGITQAFAMHMAQTRGGANILEEEEAVREFWRTQQQKLIWTLGGGYKVPREQLVYEWEGQVRNIIAEERLASSRKMCGMNHSTADPNAGSPCSIPVESLRRIAISDLVVGEANRGTIIWLKLIAPLGKMTGLSGVGADESGDATLFSLYNFVTPEMKTEACQHKYPLGTLLGIKEPYYKISNSGRLALRVDYPDNVVVALGGWDAIQVPDVSSALGFKARGNHFFAKHDYTAAAGAYSQALDVGDANAELEVVLRSNRAETHLRLGRHREAKLDAQGAIDAGASGAGLAKALLRLAKALDALGEHERAAEMLRGGSNKKRDPHTKAFLKKLRMRTEQASGAWYADLSNFTTMMGEERRLRRDAAFVEDFADFVGPLEVRAAPGGKGRGKSLL